MAGDILYGENVALAYGSEIFPKKPYGRHSNCLTRFMEISNISQTGLSLISSFPSRVCPCNDSGQPDCLTVEYPEVQSFYPGQTISLSVALVGQGFGTVAGSIYAQFLQHGSLEIASHQETVGVVKDMCNYIGYTIFTKAVEVQGVLVLTSDNRNVTKYADIGEVSNIIERWECITKQKARPENQRCIHLGNVYGNYHDNGYIPTEIFKWPLYTNVTVMSCPPGFMLTTSKPFKCDCNQLLQNTAGIQCHIQDQTFSRGGLLWVGANENENKSATILETSKYCPLKYCKAAQVNVSLSDSDSQCNYNRSGTLCGGCQHGLSLALGSLRCLPCSNTYIALIIPFLLAGIGLVLFIKLLDLTLTQGNLNGLVLYVNIVGVNGHMFYNTEHLNPLTLFIAWINLDLSIETCFFNGLTMYMKTWLQFLFYSIYGALLD